MAGEAHVVSAAGVILQGTRDHRINTRVDLGTMVGPIPGRCHRELKI